MQRQANSYQQSSTDGRGGSNVYPDTNDGGVPMNTVQTKDSLGRAKNQRAGIEVLEDEDVEGIEQDPSMQFETAIVSDATSGSVKKKKKKKKKKRTEEVETEEMFEEVDPEAQMALL